MDSKIKILFGVFVIGAVLIGGWLTSQQVFKQVKVEFPIDSEEEAIAYVKTIDASLKKSIEAFPKQVGVWAAFDKENNVWEVGISPVGITDKLYLIRFHPDGTVIFKGDVPTA